MSAPYPPSGPFDPVAQAGAEWTLRHDRGLTAAEQDDFSQWLAADPRHRMAWAEHRWGWDELDRLAGLQTSVHAVPDPDLLAPKRLGRRLSWLMPASVAAMVLGALLLYRSGPAAAPSGPAPVRSLAFIEQRVLSDGSVIILNRGAIVTTHFTAGERRVQLERGEAHFKVAKDATRPFFVEVGGVTVRAVGTAFNVRLDPASVEVLVTEGKVGVQRGRPTVSLPEESLSLSMGECTVVSLTPSAPVPQVTVVPPAEIVARLAWQPLLLDFSNAPLTEIVAEFNRRNPVRLTFRDPSLHEVRLSATFRSDNVEGFVRLLKSNFGINVEWQSDGNIVLSLADQDGR